VDLIYGGGGSGGGYSTVESAPAYQFGVDDVNSHRAVPDVSFDAGTGVSVYDTDNASTGWYTFVGTSFGTVAWSAIIAIVDQNRAADNFPLLDSNSSASDTNSVQYELYQLPTTNIDGISTIALNDITTGSNGAYSAGAGYDLVTGLGTPKLPNLSNDLTAITWIGHDGNGLWSDGGNWSDGTVPNQYDNVIIPSGVSGTITLGSGSYEANNITLSSSVTVLGTLTGRCPVRS
jgi:subtilase family serine protease